MCVRMFSVLLFCSVTEWHSDVLDCVGWLSRIRSEEVPLSLNIASAAVRGETEEADYIPEEDLRSLPETEWVSKVIPNGHTINFKVAIIEK